MDVGIVSRTYNCSVAETARAIAENGFRWTELCLTSSDADYWRYNSAGDISGLTDGRVAEIIGVYRAHGIEVASVGCFTNLIEPDDELRLRNLDYLARHMQWAAQNGVPGVATECGFIQGRRGVFADTYEADFTRLLDSVKRVAETGEQLGVSLFIEPCVIDIIPSAKRMRDFLAQVGSDRVGVLLDPANLIANSSEEDMFRTLAPHVGYFHGKDRRVNDCYGRAVGDGDIDWPLFLSLYHRHTEGVPFILEYVTPENCAEIKRRVIEFNAECGIRNAELV